MTITLKIIITLLLVSPFPLLTDVALYDASKSKKIAPPQELVGAWETQAETRVGKLRFSFNIYEDGTIEGTVGNAAIRNASLKRNRGLLFKVLGWGTDYIILGDLV
jgi:hypothetical protein